MNVSIIVIGDELLLGRVQDANSPMIARTIAPAGWKVDGVETVGDSLTDIKEAVARAMRRSPVVLTTGGIGPTKDDITRRAMMEIFGGELREDAETLGNVKRQVSLRGFPLNQLTAAQAMVPTSCQVVQNRYGTAPLMWFERDGRVLVTMPGVPFETAAAFPRDVFPRLRKRFGDEEEIIHHTLMVVGHRESELAELLAPIEEKLPATAHIAYLPEPGMVRLRIDHRPGAEPWVEEIKTLLGSHVISEEDISLAAVLINKARQRGVKIATAESCTGGNIAALITAVPGASDVMQGAVVSYSNRAKETLLQVAAADIEQHGAVSIPVVKAMATGACKALDAGLAVATSGIAGPGGGTPEKPVGMVCIAAAYGRKIMTETAHFPGSRTRVVAQASARALVMAINLLD